MSTQEKLPFQDPESAHVECATDGNPPSQKPVAGTVRALPSWLGLVTSHRRLFDASQDGWLRPLPRSDFLLGHESFVSEDLSAGRNVVPVRLAFDVDTLPFPDARRDLERCVEQSGDGDEARVVHWRAPIPLYAVKKVEVSATDQKTRLVAMAGQLSNVCLPGPEVEVGDFSVPSPAPGRPATPETKSLELPEILNAVHGAMAMAVWAVPRVEPWIEALKQALSLDAAGVYEGTRRLDAQWLQLPWLVHDLSGPARDDADNQEGLWRAALRCMQWSTVGDTSPGALAEGIAQAACRDGRNQTAETWLDGTRRLVAAEEPLTCDGWQQNGAGLAIRLALLRPDPLRFKSWSRDLPDLPPAVWWAAATLCGWRRGYRALDKKFRGGASLQEFLATRALAASWPSGDSVVLPPSQQTPLERLREDGCFTLTWRGHPVLRKPWHTRARVVQRRPDRRHRRHGSSGSCRSNGVAVPRTTARPARRARGKLLVAEHLFTRWRHACSSKGRRAFDYRMASMSTSDSIPTIFRRLLATEAGVIPDPPKAYSHHHVHEIPGLMYKPEFITEGEEAKLLALH